MDPSAPEISKNIIPGLIDLSKDESIRLFKKSLESMLTESIAALTPSEQAVINCETFQARARFLETLKSARAKILECVQLVNSAGETLSKIQAQEIARVSELIEPQKSKKSKPATWSGRGGNNSNGSSPGTSPNNIVATTNPRADTKLTTDSQLSFVRVSPSTGIYARPVELASDVRADGQIYYIRGADHFAIRVGPLFLHGNIGNIYDRASDPVRIKYCRYGSKCLRPDICNYYHDPLENLGHHDFRNFTAVSFMYSAGISEGRGYRRIGSRDRLDIDIPQLQQEEIKDFYDQVAHEFFCAVLLSQMCKV